MYSRKVLATDLSALGVTDGDVLMVHASVRAVGVVAGGPDQIHLALRDAVTQRGTLLMYAGCPQHVDEIGRGNLSPEEEAEVREKVPAFDFETARSDRSNGALVELMRTYPGSQANDHVARFVAWGDKADQLLLRQPWDYAFGRGSVLDRFFEMQGKILLIESDHDNVTFLHYTEHVADLPDKRVARFMVPVLEHGAKVWRQMEEFDTSAGAHHNWPDRFFAKIVDAFLAASGNTGGRVGDAWCYLIPARELHDFARLLMERVARAGWTPEILSQPPFR